jgi:hypothetical protein
MKTVLSGIVAVLALSAVSLAYAEPQVIGDRADSVNIKQPARHYMMLPQDFQDFVAAFALDNDQTVRFSKSNRHFYTSVDDGVKVEIFAVGPDEFVTNAGTRIKFEDQASKVVISNYERLPMVAQLPANTVVVASR